MADILVSEFKSASEPKPAPVDRGQQAVDFLLSDMLTKQAQAQKENEDEDGLGGFLFKSF